MSIAAIPGINKTPAVAATNSAGGALWTRLALELLNDCFQHQNNNIDELRYPQSLKARFRDLLLRCAGIAGFYRKPFIDYEIFKLPGLSDTYELLADEESREALIKLLAFRTLGPANVRLDLNNGNYWSLRRSLNSYIQKPNTINEIPAFGSLHLCEVNGVRLHCHELNILNTFLLEQYRCPRSGIGAKPGDIVIDAGGCWGDTALQFAQKSRHVYCFECMPSNIRIIAQNRKLNPDLDPKITVVGKALSDRSGEKLLFNDSGPGSRASGGGNIEVETQTIDDFVRENGIDRIDFIKMDIEGSEPQALAGARETLIKFRPELAISIYHKTEHFVSIPKWLNSLDLGYKFYLDHFTIHYEETVLFARSESS